MIFANVNEMRDAVRAEFDDARARRERIRKEWFVQSLMVKYGEECEGNGRIGLRYAFADLVDRRIRACPQEEFEVESERRSDQQVLPGYARILTGYSIVRDEPEWVPTEQCTDEELLAKADQLDAMARGAEEHADELRRYVRERRAAARRA